MTSSLYDMLKLIELILNEYHIDSGKHFIIQIFYVYF